jgi:hypothetical protein
MGFMNRIAIMLVCLMAGLTAKSQLQCRSAEYTRQLSALVPGLAAKQAAIESFTNNLLQRQKTEVNGNAPAGSIGFSVITIPVVVHVVYNNSPENISDAQIRSQIDVLNQDFRRRNPDTVNTPAAFRPFAADCGIEFELAKVDPHGYATTGIVRSHTAVQAFNIDDGVKYAAQGGDDAWDCNSYLNIWVTSLSSGILGYASVPGGPVDRDGITVQYTAFGTIGTATAPFNKGRTATHELGHWLNLIHTWGDADCGDDHVADTPPQKGPNRGCPGQVLITCGSGPYGDMYMNYMDFTDDGCMNTFTSGQTDRMRALFAPGGPRYALLSTQALTAIAKPDTSQSSPTAETDGEAMRVYPNPATQIIYIRVAAPLKPGLTAEIYNSMGQLVLTAPLTQPLQEVSVAGLSSGIYYLRTSSGSRSKVIKLVKL